MRKSYFVYILTRERNSVFYVGVTNDLILRINQHKQEVGDGFTKKFNIKKLVYYEEYNDIHEAIHREKIIKKWKRKYKMSAIEKINPEWKDLYFDLFE